MNRSRSCLRVVIYGLAGAVGILHGLGVAAGPEDVNGEAAVELEALMIRGIAKGPMFGLEPLGVPGFTSPGQGVEVLASLPGFGFQRRGAGNVEPFVRGLGFDRVLTTWNGLPLLNAAPTRTGAAVNQSALFLLGGLSWARGVEDLHMGPPVSGGVLGIETTEAAAGAAGWTGMGIVGIGDNPLSYEAMAGADVMEGQWRIRGAAVATEQGDYVSGGGVSIPASHRAEGGAAELSWKGLRQFHALAVMGNKVRFSENAALPQDTVASPFHAVTSVHRWVFPEDAVVQFRTGYSLSKPRLSNEHRSVRPMLVRAESFAESLHGDLSWSMRWGESVRLQASLDANRQRRDARRLRGVDTIDIIWPDIRSNHLGAALGWEQRLERFQWKLQVRLDGYRDEARKIENLSMGRSVRESYEAMYGWDEVSGRYDETLSGVLLTGGWQVDERHRLSVLVSDTRQNPTSTERFRAFLPALGGGFEIGNPELQPERRRHAELRYAWEFARGSLRLSGWLSDYLAFIQRRAIGSFAGGPLYGFRNVEAEFSGVELEGEWEVGSGWSIPLAVSWMAGNYRDERGVWSGVAEVMPLKVETGIRWKQATGDFPMVFSWRVRWHESRGNPDPVLFPTLVGGEASLVHDFGWECRLGARWELALVVKNLADSDYTHYLAHPATLPLSTGGHLQEGEGIPEPGRSYGLLLRHRF